MQYLAITGRQQELSIAELEAVLGNESIIATNDYGVILSKEPNIDFLGGTQKVFELEEVTNFSLETISKLVVNHIQENDIETRLNLAVNPLNCRIGDKLTFKVKAELVQKGSKIRIVQGKSNLLTTAESVNNGMHSKKGLELCLIEVGGKFYIGKLSQIQNLKAYTKRDQGRPKRDSKVGMLPPKLAQMIINLAQPNAGSVVLDPFCGTGVLLQEATLMGYSTYGTDISQRMIDYTRDNLEWISKLKSISTNVKLEKADAKNHSWTSFDSVACEVFLGEAFSGKPTEQQVVKEVDQVNKLIETFLLNLADQINTGQRICVAVPNWSINNQSFSLPLIDKLDQLGYTWAEFSQVDTKELVYRRPGQTVGRQLLTLTRNKPE